MKKETKTAIMKHIKNYIYLTIFVASIFSAYILGMTHGEQTVPEIPYNVFTEIEKDIISDSQYNFEVMRDLFTPMYNDSVTVVSAGYDGGWCFWVNHSRVLNSYFFDNMQSYKIRFSSLFGKIELIN